MSHADHEWAKEQIAAHLAGGLSADERARLEAHAASCAECIAELDAARRFERGLETAFAPIRPQPGLEDRILRSLRFSPVPSSRSLASRVILGVAAVFLIGLLGFVIIQVDQDKPVVEGLARVRTVEQDYSRGAQAGKSVHAAGTSELWDYAGYADGKLKEGLPSADQLANKWREEYASVTALEKFKLGKESDHNEADDEPAIAMKGDSAGASFGLHRGRPAAAGEALQRAPAEATPKDLPAVVAPAPQAKQEQVYAFDDQRRVEGKDRLDALYFKPGETADKELEKLEEIKKADPKAPANKPAGPGRSKDLNNSLMLQTGQGQAANAVEPQQPPPNPQPQRKIIRTGEVEYEIESFDGALLTITKLVEEEAGFVGTVNSDKLPNGKVRGIVVLRCPPERLDTLLLKLRGLGELKSQNIRSQDVGKQYYDLESRLKAARAMETRLLDIIAKGKGEIKDLLLAEKELGEWRTKIEAAEGEKRYYDSQISLSTLTVTLMEKELRSPSAVTQTERVSMGVEVEDVEKAHKDALAAVADAKGRVTKSELKQLAAGQFTATLHFELAPDASGPMRDRFKQLGNVARLDIDRVQETAGGVGKVADVIKVTQKDTQFFVSIYNLANIAPRETVVLSLACPDAEASYKTILARVEKAGGRVVTSSLNRQKNEQTSGSVRFEVKSAEAEAVLADVRLAGEVMRLDVTENPDTQNVTKSKRGFQVQLFAMGLVEPRETLNLQVASKNVPDAYQKLQDALAGAEARILSAQLNEQDRKNVSATLAFDGRRENFAKIDKALADAGDVLSRSSVRAQDVERVVDSKKRYHLTIVNVAGIPPRETYTLAVVVDQVEAAVTVVERLAAEAKGRVVDSSHQRRADGQDVSRVILDLPLSATRGAADRIKQLGHMRLFNIGRNPQAPEGELALGRIEVTLSNPDKLVASDSGPWERIKAGLSVGFTALSWSLTVVIVGLCFVVPVVGFYWIGRKIYRKYKPATPPVA